jgi:hypothetical protein
MLGAKAPGALFYRNLVTYKVMLVSQFDNDAVFSLSKNPADARERRDPQTAEVPSRRVP